MRKTVICHLLAWFLAVLMGTHSALFALAFDKQNQCPGQIEKDMEKIDRAGGALGN